MQISVIHGPNLNLLGTRQPEIYGSETLSDLTDKISAWASSMGVDADFAQSNSESEIVALIQDAAGSADAILLNAGGFTHTSVAIADAVASVPIPTVEVHLSDINDREPWRKRSLLSGPSIRQISGRGAAGYRDALRHLINRRDTPFETIRYGPHRDQVADTRAFDAGEVLVVLVHGGFWSGAWERDSMESIAVGLAHEEVASVNIEYRRTSRWPDSGHDALMALTSFQADGRRLIVIGHSAGGYLGMWAANRLGVDFLGLAPITSLEDIAETSTAAARLMSTGAPTSLACVSDDTRLIHGAMDDLVPSTQSTRLTGSCQVSVHENLGHFDLLDPTKPHWPEVVQFIHRDHSN